ncbi:hypothetical protein GW896_01740 [Candidatus Kuenenbacteria bacterium]|nr:hypothetical protein [Candidatus Kuenenbacteria bacterium]OIP76500.1 MAG: hypothetical protein AUK09_01875 [Parcubacteria group bacterium CG2_30_36_38]
MDLKIKETAFRIKSLKIQGATAVARAVISALRDYGTRIQSRDLKAWQNKLSETASFLLFVRPTEPMAQNAVKFLFKEIKSGKPKNVDQAKNYLKKAVNDFLILTEDAADLIIQRAQRIIKSQDNVFTHCHSFLVEQALIQAKKIGKKFQVFNTETRPLFQGHITARSLLKAGIKVFMTTDSSSAFLISHHSGKDLMMNKILLGADAILKQGGVINKVGSFGIGLAAHYEKNPLYIVTTLLKFCPKSWIKIEERPAKEIWQKAPKKLKIINFAFDFIPAQYIKGIVCEAGIIKPNEVKRAVKRIYPWI